MTPIISSLRIELAASRVLAGGLVSAYAVALTVVLLSPLPVALIGAAAVTLLLAACRDVARYAFQSSTYRIRHLVVSDTREWIAVNGAGKALTGRPCFAQLVHPWAVAFTLVNGQGKKTPVLVLPDMTSEKNFHALRLWLTLHSHDTPNVLD